MKMDKYPRFWWKKVTPNHVYTIRRIRNTYISLTDYNAHQTLST